MQRLTHIIMSLLFLITFALKYNFNEVKLSNILSILIAVVGFLVFLNMIIWSIYFVIDRFFNWYDKRKQINYSMMEWLGDTNVNINLYEELTKIKDFNREAFNHNYQIVKQKIKEQYSTKNDLKGFKNYLELRINSQKYISILNSTQAILIAIIIPTILTFLNFKDISSLASSINVVLFFIFWITLLSAIDFFARQMDLMKVLLRLVTECIEEKSKVH
ncbi:hypothetical protein A8F94_14480 [Bacillus sp. FJAT-27225]|uniref:hypothetical protein n=1 Tax=Bacillus sp. FJAT-27225 TaxID=1743144 RepID=UPI00080C2948|nr:hypothetical protein [Bacillus sp. FJAT-27225]OCA86044.1 hypothetical protein A8F94_14480 [Bacillus sp. FJAT-27225]